MAKGHGGTRKACQWICMLQLALFAPAAAAADIAWLMSIPHARSGDALYKVRILEVDGKPQKELIRYAVTPGRREITVELMLDLEWEPDLLEGQRPPPVKTLVVETEPGSSYLLGGRVDLAAPAESQLDQSFWEPVVFEQD